MKKIIFAITVVCCLVNMQCETTDAPLDIDNLLIGNWSYPEYEGNTITLQRVGVLPKVNYGLTFKTKDEFIERTSGWCATPPFYFSDYEGNYSVSDAIIQITQDHYPNNYTLRIINVSEEELVLIKELTDQERDHRDLIDKFEEAMSLIENVACENEDDWAITTYGSKACGGPQGFTAYPLTININDFLSKMAIYTEAENAYNVKWGIFSTCDVPQQPISVSCENGLPVLIY